MVRETLTGAAGGSRQCCSCRPRRSANRTSICARPGRSRFRLRPRMRSWIEIGESVHRAGLRKLIMVNSHGGNVDVDLDRGARFACAAADAGGRLPVVALRTAQGPLYRSGARGRHPCGRYGDVDDAAFPARSGAYGARLRISRRATIEIAKTFDLLRPTGLTAFGWIAQDLHRSGAAGDASRATAEKGGRRQNSARRRSCGCSGTWSGSDWGGWHKIGRVQVRR